MLLEMAKDNSSLMRNIRKYSFFYTDTLTTQEQQRIAVGPETRISFLFARCRPTQPRCCAARGPLGLTFTPPPLLLLLLLLLMLLYI